MRSLGFDIFFLPNPQHANVIAVGVGVFHFISKQLTEELESSTSSSTEVSAASCSNFTAAPIRTT